MYLRGGYAYYGKAMRADQDNADLNYNSFSLGIVSGSGMYSLIWDSQQ